MLARRRGAQLEIWAPAKLNLFLEVLSRRSDGYHQIETLMCPIGLYDTLSLEATSDDQLSLSVVDARSGPAAIDAAARVPQGADNIVIRAAELIRQKVKPSTGARLRLVKRIPLEAGLAGGSSDAAAALAGLNLLWNAGWDEAQLAAAGAELGSDIPFFFQPGMAVCGGRGEEVRPLAANPRLHFVLAHPGKGLSTAAVYRACKPAGEPRSAAALEAALLSGDLAGCRKAFANRLEEPACELSEDVRRLKASFARLDVVAHQMSGSGTSYFALCRNRKHALRTAATLRAGSW